MSAQLGLHPQYKSVLRQVKEDNPRQFLWLDACPDDDKRRNYTIRCDVISHRQYRYPDVLQVDGASLCDGCFHSLRYGRLKFGGIAINGGWTGLPPFYGSSVSFI